MHAPAVSIDRPTVTRWMTRANRWLLAGIVLLNGLVIATPFWPVVQFKIAPHRPALSLQSAPARASIDRSYNHLIIPAMQMDERILEGPTAQTINRGVWRDPHTSSPDQGGNTVLAGHRFTYYNHATPFYHLDVLKVGDQLAMAWDGKLYAYRVSNVQVVAPNNQAVLAASARPIVTLYTCTPLWSSGHRLVVTAQLVGLPS